MQLGPVKTVGEVARFGFVPSSLAREKAEMGILQSWYNIALRANVSDEEYLDTISVTPRSAISTEGTIPSSMSLPQLRYPSDNPDLSWRRWYHSPRPRRVSSIIRYHLLFICGTDFISLGPEDMQEGDTATILLGSPVPYILRPVANRLFDQRFDLVGECYVYSVIHGEPSHYVREEVEKVGGILSEFSEELYAKGRI
ncbi:hypothetical protein BU25DRAFT_219912 [Macroventuria anomochaeta]|uniref:Uncharacterized protein n=1 Tax=Macroventuria anomochaeta TaxID=301207 RepID=A0ACB6RJB0_9PLEO|nr:uncharacterized protein BU25DRAFT_219912 [Macroventuria anomochaeta]KAF2621986.1 hypothetical protein BU25DRAFT_219912 [Macroventuria anomochaeta]